MGIDDYAEWAAGVAGVSTEAGADRLSYLGLGLAAEAGEVADHVKKLLRDGRLDRQALAGELGDVIYYWACLCAATGRTPSEVLAASQLKIGRRIAAS